MQLVFANTIDVRIEELQEDILQNALEHHGKMNRIRLLLLNSATTIVACAWLFTLTKKNLRLVSRLHGNQDENYIKDEEWKMSWK